MIRICALPSEVLSLSRAIDAALCRNLATRSIAIEISLHAERWGLFFDDLQWPDKASLDLLGDMLIRSDLKYLMLIGAYRDNEVDARPTGDEVQCESRSRARQPRLR